MTDHSLDPGIETDHPRPDLRRPDWRSLDGAWDFAFDPEDAGLSLDWRDPDTAFPETIIVPYPWQSARSGLGRRVPETYVRGEGPAGGGIGWYRRRFQIPDEWTGKRLTLVVGAAYWHTTAWVDGVFAGEHDGGFEPIALDLSPFVDGGSELTLTLRVWAPDDTDEYPHGKNTEHWYTRVSGVWQSVYIEAGGPVAVRGLAVDPDSDTGRVRVVVTTDPGDGGADTKVVVTSHGPDGSTVEATGDAASGGGGETELTLEVPEPRLWAPDDPYLYRLTVTVEAADQTDVVHSYYGFRMVEFSRHDGMHLLAVNGEPRVLRAVMVQGYEPEGIWTLDSDRMRADLEEAKRLGFDLVRIHCKVEDPRMLYWADRLGMLLWCEVPNHLTPSPAAMERWERTWRKMLERDRNHPAVVLWGMFIESWGIGRNQFGFGDAVRWFAEDLDMQHWVEEMYRLGRSLDPTRPIIENSVCEYDHTVAEVNDFHLFPEGYGELPARVAETIDEFIDQAYPGSGHNFAPGYVQAGQPLLVSSMAGWSSVDGVETSWPLRVMVNEVRRQPSLAGFGWVQLYDVEWERTGLLDYRRGRKEFGFDPAIVTGPDILALDGPLTLSLSPGETTTVRPIAACSSRRPIGPGRVSARWVGVDAAGRQVAMDAYEGDAEEVGHSPTVQPLGEIEVTAPEQPFAGELRLELTDQTGSTRARGLVSVEIWHETGQTGEELPLSVWAADEPEVVEVDNSPHLKVASGLSVRLPEAATGLKAELAVVAGPPRQAGADRRYHSVEITDGSGRHQAELLELRRSSAGALSVVHPEGLGAYGELTELALTPGLVTIRPIDPSHRIAVFGPRLGRYPLGPQLLTEGGEEC